MLRIAVFYDGNYLLQVSNYYNYYHPRRTRLSIQGLHAWIRLKAGELMEDDPSTCLITAAHYFRNRVTALHVDDVARLAAERSFSDILITAGITAHFIPVRSVHEDRGAEVWLAMEAFDRARSQEFDLMVLLAGDSCYVPLVRKVQALGIPVMLLGWEVQGVGEGERRWTVKVSGELMREACYGVPMETVIPDHADPVPQEIEDLFVPLKPVSSDEGGGEWNPGPDDEDDDEGEIEGESVRGFILRLKEGYGFIERDPNNAFFHYSDVRGIEFNELFEGMEVDYILVEGGGRDGGDVARRVRPVR